MLKVRSSLCGALFATSYLSLELTSGDFVRTEFAGSSRRQANTAEVITLRASHFRYAGLVV